jgi:hypothetical protein
MQISKRENNQPGSSLSFKTYKSSGELIDNAILGIII